MSDTPRTDAITRRAVDDTGCLTNPQALWDGLEQLERELAEARKQRDTLAQALETVLDEVRNDYMACKDEIKAALAAVKGGDA
jgi:hypothetical protein